MTIQVLAGENGIISRAIEAKKKTEKTNELEMIKLAVLAVQSNLDNNWSKENLQNELKNYFKDFELTGEGTFYFNNGNSRYKISEKGNVEIIKGNSNKITPEDYGKYVEYIPPKVTEESNFPVYPKNGKWQIFYADEGNVYLIAEDNPGNKSIRDFVLEYNNTNGYTSNILNDRDRFPAAEKWLNGFKDINGNWYKSDVENMKGTLFLLDSKDIWNAYYKNDFSDWVIGGPTLELLCNSYNKINNTSYEAIAIESSYTTEDGTTFNWYGYAQTLTNALNTSFWNNNNFSYWLACPPNNRNNYMRAISTKHDYVSNAAYYDSTIGFRPIVCLNSNVILKYSNEKEMYTLGY